MALVTGASRTIGFHVARRLGIEGARTAEEMAENVITKTSASVLTKVMAEELRPSITVNCIGPGPVGADHPLRSL